MTAVKKLTFAQAVAQARADVNRPEYVAARLDRLKRLDLPSCDYGHRHASIHEINGYEINGGLGL